MAGEVARLRERVRAGRVDRGFGEFYGRVHDLVGSMGGKREAGEVGCRY